MSLFVGIVFSLGSSSAISNIIAGYMMTYRRAFKVGDRIKIGDAVGDVIQTRLQVTHLRSLKNEEVVIPNSQILGGEVLNYSSLMRASAGLSCTPRVSIGYDTPWRQVEAMLLARRGPDTRPRPRAGAVRAGEAARRLRGHLRIERALRRGRRDGRGSTPRSTTTSSTCSTNTASRSWCRRTRVTRPSQRSCRRRTGT